LFLLLGLLHEAGYRAAFYSRLAHACEAVLLQPLQ